MAGIAIGRLTEERKAWRKDHPLGFSAKPRKSADGDGLNLFVWDCEIPGKAGTIWEGFAYRVVLRFPSQYPIKPPQCQFDPPLLHPNVCKCESNDSLHKDPHIELDDNGLVCLSIVNEGENWAPTITIPQVLVGLQELLENPNIRSPAAPIISDIYSKNRPQFNKLVKDHIQKTRTPL